MHNDPDDRLYDFMQIRPLAIEFDYQLRYEVLTTRKIIENYGVVWINTPVAAIFSPKAMNIIKEICPEQVQVFDTIIECKDGVIDTYKALNILNEVDVSDPEKRGFYYLTDNKTVAGYERGGFIFKSEPMEPIHIGREKHSHATIIISATLKEAFEKAKIKGCKYWPGDDA